MPTKTLVIALLAIALVVIVFVLADDSEEAAIADQLARQQIRSAPEVPLSAGQAQPDMFQLTNDLTAERDDDNGRWLIQHKQGDSFVRLPFPPTNTGSLPDPDDVASSGSVVDANPGFVGAQACRECHEAKHEGFIHTAHHRTSGLVKPENAKGEYSQPSNVLQTSDQKLSFTMSERDGNYFQKVSFDDWSLDLPLDVFTGSAKAGQTFLYWHGDALYQAYVSYLSAFDEWIPSPGYSDTTVDYGRVIRTECLECHITYVTEKRAPNVYDRDSVVWGISCERCHGPGRDHVQYHQQYPDEKTSKHIIHPEDLPRDRQLDICGQCHSGGFKLLGDAFSFRPGEQLDEYHQLLNPDFEGVGGIHTSNQLMRLRMSKCFQQSEMTCTTCHDPHENQRGKRPLFTKGCLKCHEPSHCGMSDKLDDQKLTDRCIACHMPTGDTKGMTLNVSSGTFTVSMIDHYIRIDQETAAQQVTDMASDGHGKVTSMAK